MTATNSDTKVITGKVRLSYVHVFKPQQNDQGEERYSVSLLIPKSDKAMIKEINKKIDAAKEAGKGKWNNKIPANLKTPLRDGDIDREDDPNYKGCYFINATSKQKPGVVDRNKQEILDSTELYSGCYGRASINFYAFDTKGNRGIAAGLNNIQKLAEGDFLGGRSRAEDDFDDLEDDDDDESYLD